VRRREFRYVVMILCASRKFRNNAATSKSCRKSLLKISRGNEDHAIVSVTAVKIQLSSPSGVRRSFRSPGMLMTISTVIRERGSSLLVEILRLSGSCSTKWRNDVSIGDVRQQVNKSAGRSGDMGRVSFALHAARCIASAYADPGRSTLGWLGVV